MCKDKPLAAPPVPPEADAQKIRILEAKLAGAKRQVDRWNLCPDHRDKATGRCMVCDGERRGREEARSSAPPVPHAPTTAPMWPYAPLPPQIQEAVDQWCRSNKGGPSEFYHGVLPLGMVTMWMDRAKRAEEQD